MPTIIVLKVMYTTPNDGEIIDLAELDSRDIDPTGLAIHRSFFWKSSQDHSISPNQV